MSTKNRYYRRSRISEREFRQIIRYFALDLSASDTARLTTISVRSVNAIYIKLRRRLAGECEPQVSMTGQVEVDESYFGPKRIRGKRGRGAGSKTIVFGLMAGFTRRSCPMPEKPRCKRLSGERWASTASFIRMVGAGIMGWWMSAMRSIFGCNMAAMSLPTSNRTSTASSPFGHMPNCG